MCSSDLAGLSVPYYAGRLVETLFSFLPNLFISRPVLALVLASGMLGALSGCRGPGVAPANRWAVAPLLALPVLCMLVANLLNLYPANDFRLVHFLVVNCLLLVVLGLGIGIWVVVTHVYSGLVCTLCDVESLGANVVGKSLKVGLGVFCFHGLM